jgi:hypothetical protein
LEIKYNGSILEEGSIGKVLVRVNIKNARIWKKQKLLSNHLNFEI